MLDQYMASSRVVNGATAKCYTHTVSPDRRKLLTFIAGKRRRLLFTRRRRRSVYDKKPQRYAEDNRTSYAVINLKTQ